MNIIQLSPISGTFASMIFFLFQSLDFYDPSRIVSKEACKTFLMLSHVWAVSYITSIFMLYAHAVMACPTMENGVLLKCLPCPLQTLYIQQFITIIKIKGMLLEKFTKICYSVGKQIFSQQNWD